jgi:hypothetical protein
MQDHDRTETRQLPQGEPTEKATSGISMEDIGGFLKMLIDAQSEACENKRALCSGF